MEKSEEPTVAARILAALRETGRPMTPRELADVVEGSTYANVRGEVLALHQRRELRRLARGLYTLPDEEPGGDETAAQKNPDRAEAPENHGRIPNGHEISAKQALAREPASRDLHTGGRANDSGRGDDLSTDRLPARTDSDLSDAQMAAIQHYQFLAHTRPRMTPQPLEGLSSLIESGVGATLFVVDEELHIARIEGDLHLLTLAGYTRGELLGQALREALRPRHYHVLAPLYEAALRGYGDAIREAYSGVEFNLVFVPAFAGERRYAVALCSPVYETYSDGMKQRSEVVVLRQRGAWNMELAMVMRADDPLTVDVELPMGGR